MIRAGTYAKANVASRSWLQTPVAVTAAKNKRKITSTVVHPVFGKCAELTADPFWVDLFHSASRGKFPKGFSYKEGLLFHRKRNKTSSVEISENPIEALEVCKTFFRSMGGIASQQEHSHNDSEDTNTSGSIEDTSTEAEVVSKPVVWSKIVPKKNKTLYLHSFIEIFAKHNNMSLMEMDKLQKTLNLAESLNLLTDINVIFDGNSINQIIGLSFNKETREMEFEPLNHPLDFSKKQTRSSKTKSVGKQGFFLKLWDKYLTTYSKAKTTGVPITGFPVTGAPRTLLVIRTSRPDETPSNNK